MKSKGFTLIELLGVIILLGVIALITVPTINILIEDSRERLLKKQYETIKTSAKNYMNENMDILDLSNNYVTISIFELKNLGYLKTTKINNPVTKEEMDGCVLSTYDFENNQYKYDYYEKKCDDLDEFLPKPNLLSNSMLKTDTTGWTLLSNVTRDETVMLDECVSVKSTQSGLQANAYRGISNRNKISTTINETYTASIYVKWSDYQLFDTYSIILEIREFDSSGTRLHTSYKYIYPSQNLNNAWQKLEVTKTITDSNTKSIDINAYVLRNGTAWFACPKLEKNSIATVYMP